jgi:hypothetical protein
MKSGKPAGGSKWARQQAAGQQAAGRTELSSAGRKGASTTNPRLQTTERLLACMGGARHAVMALTSALLSGAASTPIVAATNPTDAGTSWASGTTGTPPQPTIKAKTAGEWRVVTKFVQTCALTWYSVECVSFWLAF